MNVLLTGGGGFFGSSIIKTFLEHGHQLTVVSRSKPSSLTKANLHYLNGDITRPKTLEALAGSHFDLLIHSAAFMPKSPKDNNSRSLIHTNISGTLCVMEKLAPIAQKVIYVSSIDVYGGTQLKAKPLTESAATKPRSLYGLTKLTGEQISQIYCQRLQIPLTILRFTVLYGPGDVIDRAIPNYIKNALGQKPLIVPEVNILRDYLATSEASRALYLAAMSQKTGIYNIGSGKSQRVQKAALAIRTATHSRSRLIAKSSGASQFHVRLNVRRAQKDFHFSAKPFPFDLQKTIQSYR